MGEGTAKIREEYERPRPSYIRFCCSKACAIKTQRPEQQLFSMIISHLAQHINSRKKLLYSDISIFLCRFSHISFKLKKCLAFSLLT